ncbi:MAG: hypothetical protein H0U42_09085 [Thermoleophilaceae bacterium]|nr:hypothetical protein [Thermoleophilaceae bacterium]
MGGQSMMAGDMTLMAVAMVIRAVILAAALIAGIYLVLRAVRGSERPDRDSTARSLLDRRLAAGEISIEEYTDRCGAMGAQTQASAP